MKFKVINKNGTEKMINAKNLKDAEEKAGKKWVDIIMIDTTKGEEIY